MLSSSLGVAAVSVSSDAGRLGRGVVRGRLLVAVAALLGGRRHLERRRRVLQLLGVLALLEGTSTQPVSPFSQVWMVGKASSLARGVRHLEGQLEGVALAVGQRVLAV